MGGHKRISPAEILSCLFKSSGYVRWQNAERPVEGAQSYKKGDEVRLMVDSYAELQTLRDLLSAAGFAPGAPFRKHKRYCQPLYGRAQVARFLDYVQARPVQR